MVIDGTANTRDLGGLARVDGSTTPSGTYFRSASVDGLTDRGWEQLHAFGVRTVVDLRQPGEVAADTGTRPSWLTTRHVDLDGLDDDPDFWAGYWDNGLVATALYYLPHLRALPERWAAAVEAVVTAPPGGVLFHCAGGRDRTGIVALVLLAAADVTPEAIVGDYLETVRWEAARRDAGLLGSFGEAEIEALCRAHGSTTEDAFRDALSGFALDEVASLLDATTRDALRTWRGALP